MSETVKGIACQLLRTSFHGAVSLEGVVAIGTSSDSKKHYYNLEKMSFKGLLDGSSDAAGKGELGE